MNGLNKYQIFKDATLSPHWHMYVHIPFCPRKCVSACTIRYVILVQTQWKSCPET